MLCWQLDHRPPRVTKKRKRKRARGLGRERGKEEPRPRVSFWVLGAVTTAFQRESGRGESQSHSGPSLRGH